MAEKTKEENKEEYKVVQVPTQFEFAIAKGDKVYSMFEILAEIKNDIEKLKGLL